MKFPIETMENLCERFPHLAENIFDQLDDESLNESKEISGEVLEFLENGKFFWIRIIQVNLCQKLSFLCQLTHNMMTDFSLNYEFST